MTVAQQLHHSATHKDGPDPNCPVCNPVTLSARLYATEQLRKLNESQTAITATVLRRLLEDAYREGASLHGVSG